MPAEKTKKYVAEHDNAGLYAVGVAAAMEREKRECPVVVSPYQSRKYKLHKMLHPRTPETLTETNYPDLFFKYGVAAMFIIFSAAILIYTLFGPGK